MAFDEAGGDDGNANCVERGGGEGRDHPFQQMAFKISLLSWQSCTLTARVRATVVTRVSESSFSWKIGSKGYD